MGANTNAEDTGRLYPNADTGRFNSNADPLVFTLMRKWDILSGWPGCIMSVGLKIIFT